MMERVSIQEIAAILVEKNGLKKKEAEQFVLTLFQLVKEGLATDRLVKVKGLGTFKMVEIEARESVNVNTGERVVIDGHEKVSFTPDATMKELVNKPFSQFETVVLNDGV
jgi:nucleoid DNA-binding protein